MGNAPSFTLGGKSIVPFQYAFSTHGHNLSAAFRQRHSKCVFDTWRFLRQGLLQRNDVFDIITRNKRAGGLIPPAQNFLNHPITNCHQQHHIALAVSILISYLTSHIQTILSAPDSHQVMPCGSRAYSFHAKYRRWRLSLRPEEY